MIIILMRFDIKGIMDTRGINIIRTLSTGVAAQKPNCLELGLDKALEVTWEQSHCVVGINLHCSVIRITWDVRLE